MNVFYIILGFIAGVLAALWFIRFRHRRAGGYIVVYDGSVPRAYPARPTAGGVVAKTADGPITYPSTGITKLIGNPLTQLPIFVFGAEQIALAKHEALEVGRQGIAFAAMFKSGGDMKRFLELGALIVPIAVAFVLYTTISGQTQQLVQLQASVAVMQKILDKPLQVAPAAPTEVPK